MIPSDEVENLKVAEQLINERPGDAVFERVKPLISEVNKTAQEFSDAIKKLILDDMAFDVGLASAIDDVCEVIEYHAQHLEIERPKFDALAIAKICSRVTNLAFIQNVAELRGLDSSTIEKITIAEIERSWFDSRPTPERQERTMLKIPEELSGLIREIARSLSRKESHAKSGIGTRSVGTRGDKPAPGGGGGSDRIPRGRKA